MSSALSLFEDDDVDDGLSEDVIFGSKTKTIPHSTHNIKRNEALDNISDKDTVIGSNIPKSVDIPQLSTVTSSDLHEKNSSGNDKKLPASSILGIFDDDDPDDGDLFDSKFVTKLSKDLKDQREKQKPQVKSIPNVAIASKTSLFGDQDTDDDDDSLFGGPPPLPEPIKQSQPKKVNQKIFSDDSDDDLFGGGKTIAQKIPPKSNAGSSSSKSTSTIPKTTKNTKANKKLFSDSEDDDLFGGNKSKSTGKFERMLSFQFNLIFVDHFDYFMFLESSNKKVKSISMSKAIKEDPTKSVKMLSPSSVDNDPLADLLK